MTTALLEEPKVEATAPVFAKKFKVGDLVIIKDSYSQEGLRGRHGAIKSDESVRWVTVFGGGSSSSVSEYYSVETNAGYVTSIISPDDLEALTADHPADTSIIPDPRHNGLILTPEMFERNIGYTRENARKARRHAERRRKAEYAKKDRDDAANLDAGADEMLSIYNAWRSQHGLEPFVEAQPKRVVVPAGDGKASMRINAERQGVELRFSAKPSDGVLSSLKSNGWRWARGSKCWYRKDTEDARAFAQSLTAA